MRGVANPLQLRKEHQAAHLDALARRGAGAERVVERGVEGEPGAAVVGAVVGEFVGGEAGLGYMLIVANGSMDTSLLFAGLIALTIQGVVLYALVEWAEYLAIPRRSTAAIAALHAAVG